MSGEPFRTARLRLRQLQQLRMPLHQLQRPYNQRPMRGIPQQPAQVPRLPRQQCRLPESQRMYSQRQHSRIERLRPDARHQHQPALAAVIQERPDQLFPARISPVAILPQQRFQVVQHHQDAALGQEAGQPGQVGGEGGLIGIGHRHQRHLRLV